MQSEIELEDCRGAINMRSVHAEAFVFGAKVKILRELEAHARAPGKRGSVIVPADAVEPVVRLPHQSADFSVGCYEGCNGRIDNQISRPAAGLHPIGTAVGRAEIDVLAFNRNHRNELDAGEGYP